MLIDMPTTPIITVLDEEPMKPTFPSTIEISGPPASMEATRRIGAYELELRPSLIPSGQFLAAAAIPAPYSQSWDPWPIRSSTIEIYNPMPHPSYVAEYSEKRLGMETVEARLRDARCVTDVELAEYSECLVEIATAIRRKGPPDCVIAPLRGALKPALLLKVIGDFKCIEYLPFQDRSDTHRRKAMETALEAILKKRAPDRDVFRVFVVDTAIGGYGVQDLSAMIANVGSELGCPHLDVQFHLLHDITRAPHDAVARIESIRRMNTDMIRFTVWRHPVASLIVEDWDPALGIEL